MTVPRTHSRCRIALDYEQLVAADGRHTAAAKSVTIRMFPSDQRFGVFEESPAKIYGPMTMRRALGDAAANSPPLRRCFINTERKSSAPTRAYICPTRTKKRKNAEIRYFLEKCLSSGECVPRTRGIRLDIRKGLPRGRKRQRESRNTLETAQGSWRSGNAQQRPVRPGTRG